MSLAEPVDDLHAACLDAISDIRVDVAVLRAKVELWEPRPCPEPKP